MKNISMEKKGNILVIKIDLDERHGLSKSEKTTVVATTSGNVKVPGAEHISIGINAYTKP